MSQSPLHSQKLHQALKSLPEALAERSLAGFPRFPQDQNHPNWLIKPRGKPMVSETPILGNTQKCQCNTQKSENMHGTPMQMHVVAQFTIQSGI